MNKIPRFIAVLVVAAIGLFGCTSSQYNEDEPATSVRIGYQVIPNGDPIVRHHGWLEDLSGLDVSWIQFSSGAEVNVALQTGQIDIGLVGSNPAVIGIGGGIDYSVIWIFNLIGENEALVVKGSSSSSKDKSLAGKRIATPFGSTAHYSLMSYLEINGYSEGEVAILDLQPQDALAAWDRGDIDGAYVWNPVLGAMKSSGGVVVTDSDELAQQGFPTADLAVATNTFIESNPQFLFTWVDMQSRAVDFIRENPELSSEIIAAEFGISQSDAGDQLSQIVLLNKSEQRDFFGAGGHEGSPMLTLLSGTASFLFNQERLPLELSNEDLLGRFTDSFLQN